MKEKIEDKVAFCIKTFIREDSLVTLMESVKKFYPGAKVYIADDGNLTASRIAFYSRLEHMFKDIKIFMLPFDTGLSYGRNFLIKNSVEPYILILEDDFIFTEGTKLEPLVDFLESSNNKEFGIVGGIVYDKLKHSHDFNCNMRLNEKHLEIIPNKSEFVRSESGLLYKQVDKIFNFFIARREVFNNILWDPDLKICEHIAFFFHLKYKTSWKVAFTKDVSIHHVHLSTEKESAYKQYRIKRAQDFLKLSFLKMGITGYSNVGF